jgi:hypothetical protein
MNTLRNDNTTVYFIVNGEVHEESRNELIAQYTEQTTTPLGIGDKIHVRGNELWTGQCGNFPRLLRACYDSEDEALDAAWDMAEYDFYNSPDAPILYDSEAAAQAALRLEELQM